MAMYHVFHVFRAYPVLDTLPSNKLFNARQATFYIKYEWIR